MPFYPDFRTPQRRLRTLEAAIGGAVSVFVVPEERERNGTQVRPDLMRPSGYERNLQQTQAILAAHQTVMRFDGQ